MEFVHTHTESEALLLESNLIKKLRPPYNVVLRDDKSYPYIHVATDHDYPRAVKYRGSKKNEGQFFGPFASAGAVNKTLIAMQKAFQIRNCSEHVFHNRTRPCLQYHIKRCTAPCVNYVSRSDYNEQVQDMLDFLSGKSQKIKQRLNAEMQEASENLEFERAAAIRNRLYALGAITASQDINIEGVGDADVIGIHEEGGKISLQVFFFRGGQNYGNRNLIESRKEDMSLEEMLSSFIAQFYENKPIPPTLYVSHMPDEQSLIEEAFSERLGRKVQLIQPQRGEKVRLIEFVQKNAEQALVHHFSESATQTKLLQAVAELFDLDAPPERIEVYDNSHLSGTGMVGAMIVAGPEGFRKNAYRKFNIRGAGPSDDYAAMQEMMRRRFGRALKENEGPGSQSWPDLILIDGGKGQLSSVISILEELNIAEELNVVGISKGPDRHAGREEFHQPGKKSFQLPQNDTALHYLQRLRDEAHRFAIGAQRTKRSMAVGGSPLDDIPGIGPQKKKALLSYFGSSKGVAKAGIEDLIKVEGINEATARTIYHAFHS
jgi:excinuclease ABC subunit C